MDNTKKSTSKTWIIVLAGVCAILALGVGVLATLLFVQGQLKSTSASKPSSEVAASQEQAAPYDMVAKARTNEYGSYVLQDFDDTAREIPVAWYSFDSEDSSTDYLTQVRDWVADDYFAKLVDEKAVAPESADLTDVKQRQVLVNSRRVDVDDNDRTKAMGYANITLIDTLRDGSTREKTISVEFPMRIDAYRYEWEGQIKSINQPRLIGEVVESPKDGK